MENRENDMEKAGSSPLLEVEHLEVSFLQYERGWSQKTIVPIRDLSLSVHSGEMVAVVGSSGSGKSLLAHAVMGLLPYNGSWKGDIRYKGELLTEKRLKSCGAGRLCWFPRVCLTWIL